MSLVSSLYLEDGDIQLTKGTRKERQIQSEEDGSYQFETCGVGGEVGITLVKIKLG
jgi:hypothetical protein